MSNEQLDQAAMCLITADYPNNTLLDIATSPDSDDLEQAAANLALYWRKEGLL